ncbi:MAG: hypothetical protein AAF449_02410, partial [Myxococcota bacterium]
GAPNTIDGCADDNTGGYLVDESLEALTIESVDGSQIESGSAVRVRALVFPFQSGGDDALDIFHAPDATAPVWTLIGTEPVPGPGLQTLTHEFVLPTSTERPAIRAQFRFAGGPSPCAGSVYSDRDDLVFTVTPPVVATFDAALGVPACPSNVSSCVTGTLVRGRGTVGPETNAPNTLDACADGNAGTFQSDESLDALQVRTTDGAPFSPGSEVDVTASVFAFEGAFADDSLDIYYALSPSNPQWVLAGSAPAQSGGRQDVTVRFTIPVVASGAIAIRGQWRFGAGGSPCVSNDYNDRDDLVVPLAPVIQSYALALSASGTLDDADFDGILDTATQDDDAFAVNGVTAEYKEGIIEFDVSAVAAGTLQSAEIDVSFVSNLGVSATINIYAYAGDGVVTLSDRSVPGEVLAASFDPQGLSVGANNYTIVLDPATIQPLLGASNHFGFRMESSDLVAQGIAGDLSRWPASWMPVLRLVVGGP